MTTFDSRQLPLPLNPRLSHPPICTPTDRILHHHSHFTRSARNYFLHLPQRRLTGNTGAQNINLETRASRPYGHDVRFLFQTILAYIMLTLHSDLHHAHNEANMHKRHLRRYRRFYFFGTSLPQQRGRGGVGARSSSSKNPQLPQQQQRAPGETR
jgi:hypothetical protein